MEINIEIQDTPNPNTLKYALNKTLITDGSASFANIQDCQNNPLARAIFETAQSIKEVFISQNCITVTRDGSENFDEFKNIIRSKILENIENSDMPQREIQEEISEESHKLKEETPETEINKIEADSNNIDINSAIDELIRPALQKDGGDLEIIDYKENVLTISYQGACGICPYAATATLNAIQNILKEKFNPEIVVKIEAKAEQSSN